LLELIGKNIRADNVLEHTIAVIAATQRLNPAVIDIKKTERWCKLRVYRVLLNRYIESRGLDTVREEIEVMIGITLLYAPR
jgi:hypothetical protein